MYQNCLYDADMLRAPWRPSKVSVDVQSHEHDRHGQNARPLYSLKCSYQLYKADLSLKFHFPDPEWTVFPSSSNFINTCKTPCDAGRCRLSGTSR